MEPALVAVERVAAGARESAMIGACQRRDDRAGCGMRIASGVPTESNRYRDLRRSPRAHYHPHSAVKKTACGTCGQAHRGWYDRKRRRVRDLACGDVRIYLEFEVRRVACRRGGKVKQERLDFLADNPFYSKRFAFYVGRRCRASPIRDVAKELRLDGHTGKALEQQYMREQLRRAGTPGPRGIGLDEVSVRTGHTYRIIVSDLIRQRPIWFGGTDRSETSLDQCRWARESAGI
jgi:transposase